MIILFHGDDIESSRMAFQDYITKNAKGDVRHLDGKHIGETELIQSLESHALFASEQCTVIESLFSPLGARKTKKAEQYAAHFSSIGDEQTVILWEPKELGKELLGLLPKKTVSTVFSYPKVIFTFLDAIKPGNGVPCIQYLAQVIQTEPVERVWSMVVSRIRQLMQCRDGVMPDKTSPWQQTRLTNQARLFTMDKLVQLHTALRKSEYALKNGTTPFQLRDLLEHILIRL